MKTKIVALIASGLFAAGIWGYSQHMGEGMQTMCPWLTQSDVQRMHKNPMMGSYAHMGQTRVYPDSPMSIVALQDEVGVSNDQVKRVDIDPRKSQQRCKSCFDSRTASQARYRYEELETNVYVPVLEFDEPIIP